MSSSTGNAQKSILPGETKKYKLQLLILLIFMMCVSLLLLTINSFDGNNKSTVMEMALIEVFCSYS